MPLPAIGNLPGKLYLNPTVAPQTADPSTRPLGPGEYLENPDGGWSNEMSATVADPGLNGGQATNVPTLWIVNGKPMRVSEDQAAQLAAKSGLAFPGFKTIEEADQAAAAREAQWQKIKPQDAGSVAPLWSMPGSGGTP
jgi:hypothetical protein